MALAEKLHHSSRGQKMARAGGEARDALHGHVAVAPLSQGRVLRHVVGHLPVPALDVPVPQMVDQLPNVVQFLAAQLLVAPEPVIKVPKILPHDIPPRRWCRDTQLVEQLVEVPTTLSYSSLFQRTVEQHVDIPVPGDGGGPISGLQGFSSGQRSTASPSRKRISERIVEQIVDPVSRGGVFMFIFFSLSNWCLMNALMNLVKGFFALFPKFKKSAKVAPHSGSELPPHPSSSTLAPQLEVSVEWVRLREKHAGKTYFWNRRTNSTVWRAPAGVEVVWYSEKDEVGGVWYWHRDTRVSTFDLLFILGEEQYRQPRAVYKYWVGGLPSCDHAATCFLSSSSFIADMDQKDRCSGRHTGKLDYLGDGVYVSITPCIWKSLVRGFA